MKIYFLIFFIFISCRFNKVGSFTEGYVYDKSTNQYVNKASVCLWSGSDRGFVEITKTNDKGYFSFKENSDIKFGNNGKDLAIEFIIKKGKLISDTLISYPNQDTIKFDKIYLK